MHQVSGCTQKGMQQTWSYFTFTKTYSNGLLTQNKQKGIPKNRKSLSPKGFAK